MFFRLRYPTLYARLLPGKVYKVQVLLHGYISTSRIVACMGLMHCDKYASTVCTFPYIQYHNSNIIKAKLNNAHM